MPAWLYYATGTGEWVSPDGTQRGEFRIVADMDWATLRVYNGPEYLEEDNPIPLRAHSLLIRQGGRAILASFDFLPMDCRGEVLLDDRGHMEGSFVDAEGEGRYVGTVSWREREYVSAPPRPKISPAREPTSAHWQAPSCLQDGRVLLLGVGGASRSGKGTLASRLADELAARGLNCCLVHQDNYIKLAGSYIVESRRGNVEVDNFETPSSISWRDFCKDVGTAAKKVTPEDRGRRAKPGIVIAEGFLLYWMHELNEAFHLRLFLRASQQEVSSRRQQSKPLPTSFLEHVFWPSHLAYGQPQAPAHEIIIEDGQQAYPLPDSMLAAALKVLRDHGGDELSRALTRKASPGRKPSASSQAAGKSPEPPVAAPSASSSSRREASLGRKPSASSQAAGKSPEPPVAAPSASSSSRREATTPSGARGSRSAASCSRDSVLTMFGRVDKSGSGVIPKQEFIRVLKALDARAWSDAKISSMLVSTHTLQGGQVDYPKFVDWVFGGSLSEGSGGNSAASEDVERKKVPTIAAGAGAEAGPDQPPSERRESDGGRATQMRESLPPLTGHSRC